MKRKTRTEHAAGVLRRSVTPRDYCQLTSADARSGSLRTNICVIRWAKPSRRFFDNFVQFLSDIHIFLGLGQSFLWDVRRTKIARTSTRTLLLRCISIHTVTSTYAFIYTRNILYSLYYPCTCNNIVFVCVCCAHGQRAGTAANWINRLNNFELLV